MRDSLSVRSCNKNVHKIKTALWLISAYYHDSEMSKQTFQGMVQVLPRPARLQKSIELLKKWKMRQPKTNDGLNKNGRMSSNGSDMEVDRAEMFCSICERAGKTDVFIKGSINLNTSALTHLPFHLALRFF